MCTDDLLPLVRQGVCNVTVYIEGMEDELEHFPQLIDDNGFDTYPKFVSW